MGTAVLARWAAARFADWNWVVAASSDIDEFRHDAYTTRDWMIGGSIVAVLVIFALLFLLISRRLAPLAEFIADAERLGNGDLDVRIGYRRADEIGCASSPSGRRARPARSPRPGRSRSCAARRRCRIAPDRP